MALLSNAIIWSNWRQSNWAQICAPLTLLSTKELEAVLCSMNFNFCTIALCFNTALAAGGSKESKRKEKPVHVDYFSTSSLKSDHKCLYNELTNPNTQSSNTMNYVARTEKDSVWLSPVFLFTTSQLVNLAGRFYFYFSTHRWPAPHQKLSLSIGKETQQPFWQRQIRVFKILLSWTSWNHVIGENKKI